MIHSLVLGSRCLRKRYGVQPFFGRGTELAKVTPIAVRSGFRMEITGGDGCGDFPDSLTRRVEFGGIARGLRFTLIFQVIEHEFLRIVAPGFLCCQSIYRKLDTPAGFLLVLGRAAL